MKKMSEFEFELLFEMYKDTALQSAWHLRKAINEKTSKTYEENDLYKLTRQIQLYQCKKYGATLCGHDIKFTREDRRKINQLESHRKSSKKR